MKRENKEDKVERGTKIRRRKKIRERKYKEK